jgi:hypothetical protein
MDGIYETNDMFNFDKLILTKPTQIPGGNYFIKLLVNDKPLYIQPPKCNLKQGISKAGKRMFADLMFSNENDQFIRWMENLENHCQNNIYKNRQQWFDGDLEMTDIENYFTSSLKIYKSGKYYIIRTNITTALGKSILKIYDENENEVDMDKINEDMNIMTILEIQGIKCSARSFQLEIELKQMLVLNHVNIFDKCLLTKKASNKNDLIHVNSPNKIEEKQNINDTIECRVENNEEEHILSNTISDDNVVFNETHTEVEQLNASNEQYSNETTFDASTNFPVTISNDVSKSNSNNEEYNENTVSEENTLEKKETEETEMIKENEIKVIEPNENKFSNGLEEVSIPLDDLPEDDKVQIKQRNEVYYEMYREARRKAKIARNLALSSYLEAKRIKNTYMLDDLKDSDDSDLDIDLEDEEKYE